MSQYIIQLNVNAKAVLIAKHGGYTQNIDDAKLFNKEELDVQVSYLNMLGFNYTIHETTVDDKLYALKLIGSEFYVKVNENRAFHENSIHNASYMTKEEWKSTLAINYKKYEFVEVNENDSYAISIKNNNKTIYVNGFENGKPRISNIKPKVGVDYQTATTIHNALKLLVNQLNLGDIKIEKCSEVVEEQTALTYELKLLRDEFWKTVHFDDKCLIILSNGIYTSCVVKQNPNNPSEGILVDHYGNVIDENYITHITKI